MEREKDESNHHPIPKSSRHEFWRFIQLLTDNHR